MQIWAIADLHLSFGVPEKTMEIFGAHWKDYQKRLETQWRAAVQPEDLVLVAGDISWALSLEQAKIDLDWIDHLPGIKVLVKGNHDYWWGSLSKVKKILPTSLNLIQNDAFDYQGVSIAGARLWDTEEFFYGNQEKIPGDEQANQEKIFNRELQRLETSLKDLNPQAKLRIAMTHYPPIGPTFKPTRVSKLLEKYQINICVFGHLHNFHKETLQFGKIGSITYYLTSADYLSFAPLNINQLQSEAFDR
jgi:predicted phosphohydrolase